MPLVPQAVVFDLLNGGDKDWGRYPPYRELGYEAASRGRLDFELGTVGGGYGATTVNLKGGLGIGQRRTRPPGHTVGAIVVVNSISSAVIGDGPHFWAGAFEEGDEFGGLGHPARVTPEMRELPGKAAASPRPPSRSSPPTRCSRRRRPSAWRISSHGGFARALRFAHALYDGDTVFAASTGRRPLGDEAAEFTEIAALAGRLPRPRHRARRLRGDRAALSGRAAGLAGSVWKG